MSKYIIEPKVNLNGEIEISGSKNAALPILCASLLCDGETKFHNVPKLSDIDVMLDILSQLGCKVSFSSDECKVDSSCVNSTYVSFDLASKIRASFLAAGPLLARFGKARVALPGGCAIGSRPLDLHLKGFKALGAKCDIKDGYITLTCPKLKGTHIYLDFPSVGATENIIMAATLASGTTVLENCASEPEIIDLANFLKLCNGKIFGAGTDKITIIGTDLLRPGNYSIIPDRIEAGTFMIAAALSGGNIKLKNVDCSHLSAVSSKLSEIGAKVCEFGNEISICCPDELKPTHIKTMPFPGFPTDLQAPFASLLSSINGTSLVTETVFENRFMYIPELIRMNADIKLDGRTAIISGKNNLKGSLVRSTDLRAGAALVVAALGADGKTTVEDNNNYIKRGYCDFSAKLQALGACISEIE